jgi:hypothetical protein
MVGVVGRSGRWKDNSIKLGEAELVTKNVLVVRIRKVLRQAGMDISPVGRKAKYMYYLEGGSVTKKLIDIRVFGVELGVLGSLDRVIDKENV